MPEPRVYASLEDVQAAYEHTIPAGGEVRVERLVEQASVRLRRRVPNLNARIDAGKDEDLAALARGVVVDAVLRVIRNPNGYSAEQAGEFSYRIDRAVSSGRLTFPDDDLADLLPRASRVRSVPVGIPEWMRP